jgi:hypothetical protein
MQIRKKTDITFVLDNFSSLAEWDEAGAKFYFVLEDRKRGGQWTLMRYEGDRYSVHGRGSDYLDEEESFFEDNEALTAFLWNNRAAFNAAVKPISVSA